MVPPGGVAVTATPLRGSSPSAPPDLPLGRFTKFGGTLNLVFLCQDIRGAPASVGNAWYNSKGPLPCDLGPDTESLAVCWYGSSGPDGHRTPCTGRNMFTFAVPNTRRAVMPRFRVPATGVSWMIFAWISPGRTSAASGVATAGRGLARFTGYGLSFSYPRSWHSLVPRGVPGGPPEMIVFEGTDPLRDSCPVSTWTGGGSSGGYPCGRAPVTTLPPGGVLVSWSTAGRAVAGRLPGELGTSQTIAGRPASVFSGSALPSALPGVGNPPSSSIVPRLSIQDAGEPAGPVAGPTCRQLGGTRLVAAAISLGPDSVDLMMACIREPRASQSAAEVITMLRSLRLAA
jgi:hypothetical protein